MRLVIGPEAMRSSEWTLPTTMSRRLSSSGVWSSDPSDRMSTSMPVRIRNGASSAFRAATSSSCRSSRSARQPVGDRQRGRVVGQHHVLVAEPDRAVSAISRIGDPPSLQSECTWQSPRSASHSSAADLGHHPAAGRLQPAQVDRLLAAQALGDGPLGHLADAGQAAQRPALHVLCERLRLEPGQRWLPRCGRRAPGTTARSRTPAAGRCAAGRQSGRADQSSRASRSHPGCVQQRAGSAAASG